MTLEKSAWFLLRLLSFGGEARETNACFGNSRKKVEVLPVCLAPVSTTTGRVFAERRKRGSTARGIHICKIMQNIRYNRIGCTSRDAHFQPHGVEVVAQPALVPVGVEVQTLEH